MIENMTMYGYSHGYGYSLCEDGLNSAVTNLVIRGLRSHDTTWTSDTDVALHTGSPGTGFSYTDNYLRQHTGAPDLSAIGADH